MATATITFDLADLLGVTFDERRTRVWISTNVPSETIVDTNLGEIRLGSGKVNVNADGTGSFTTWVPSWATNPASWQTYVNVEYPDSDRRKGRNARTFGPFTITGDADLADLIEEQEIPPDFSGSGFIASVEAIRDQQVDLSNISTSDDVVEGLLKGTAGAGPKTRAQLGATYAARGKVVPAAVADTYGHSFMFGSTTGTGGSVTGTSDMATLIANGINLPIKQHAVSGAALYTAASAGDWADVMQDEVRGVRFEPRGGAYAVIYGLNDAANIGHTYSALAPFKTALTAITARMRASAVFENDHSSMSTSGTWSVTAGTNRNSGSSFSYANTAGATQVWTPPADFPGGTITAVLPAYGDGGTAVWTAVVNGITYTVDTSTYALTGNNPTVGVMRIPNVKRTNGPITFTVTSVSGAGAARAMWDCVMWEPAEAACPVVALIGQPKPLDYTSQAGAPAGPVTDAGVDAINQIIGEVVALFGERVVYVNTSAIDSSATYWAAGNVHPNALGHAYIANQTIAAIKAAASVVPSPSKDAVSATRSDAWTNYVPALTGITLGNGTLLAAYCTRENGSVEFYVKVTLGSTSAITGDVTIELPAAAVAGGYTKMGFEVLLFDSGTARYKGGAYLGSVTAATVRSLGTNGVMTALSAASPFTWTTSDAIELGGSYRKA